MRLSLIPFSCLLLLSLQSARGEALEYTLHDNNLSPTLTAILATGEVRAGDVERLQALLTTLPKKWRTAIYLASDGGNLHDGMRLGLFFQANRIQTVVEGGRNCASACALAFLGGTDDRGAVWRSSSTNSKLGFHAFRSMKGHAIDADQVQQVVAAILSYGKLVHAPIDLLIAGFATPSGNIYWVSNQDICALGTKLWSNEA